MVVDRRQFLGLALGAAVTAPAFGRAPGQRRRFAPEIGVCAGLDRAAVAKEAGCAYLEVGCSGAFVPGADGEQAAAALAAVGAAALPVRAANGFLPGSLRCTGPAADHAAVLDWAETVFARAAQTGVGIITFGSSGARSIPDGYPGADAELQFVSLLGRMGDRAAGHGVLVCLEPLQPSETNFVHRVTEGLRLVRAVGHPAVALTADIFHMLRSDEGPDAIREAGALVRHVHIAEKASRTPPGHDGDDFRPYLLALEDIGYSGRISIECRWDDFRTELPTAVRTLRAQIAELG